MSYYRLVISRAFAKTKDFWNLHQIWKYASTPISAIVLRLAIERLSPVMGWERFLIEIVVFLLFGFIVTWGGTFCINLIRVPPILHGELTAENAKLVAIAHPRVSPDEERKRDLVEREIKRLSQGQKRMLRHILDFGPVDSLSLMNSNEFDYAELQITFASGVLFQLNIMARSGKELSVKSDFKSALDFVLNSEGI